MIRRTLIIGAALLAAACLYAGAAAPARAASPNAQMREALVALRGLIERQGAVRYFEYPTRSTVRPGHLPGAVGNEPRHHTTGRAIRGTTST